MLFSGNKETKGNFRDIGTDEALKLLKNPPDSGLCVLDVRTEGEFAGGHIENAVNIDYFSENSRKELGGLDKAGTCLVYCKSGNRSGKAVSVMKEMGFRAAHSLKGGIVEWESSGLPLKK